MIGDNLPYDVRRRLLVNRTVAMRLGLDAFTAEQDDLLAFCSQKASGHGLLAANLLSAEIHYLDDANERAIQIFENEVLPSVRTLPDEEQIVISDNRLFLSGPQERIKNQHAAHMQRVAAEAGGVRIWNPEDILSAINAAEEGKHYEALDSYWHQLREAQRTGCWRLQRLAHTFMAKECLLLNWARDALYHSVLGQNEGLASSAAERLLQLGNANEIVRAVMLHNYANLRRHSLVFCTGISKFGDAIPDSHIHDLFNWLLYHCQQKPSTNFEQKCCDKAWDALNSIADRLDATESLRVFETATTHAMWNAGNNTRQRIITGIRLILGKLLDAKLQEVTDAAFKLIEQNTEPPDDIPSILELLIDVAKRGDSNLKRSIRQRFSVVASNCQNLYMAEAADQLGVNFEFQHSLKQMSGIIAGNIRNHVQRLDASEEPTQTVGSYGAITTQDGDKKIVVSISGADELEILLTKSHRLAEESINELLKAILETMSSPHSLIKFRVDFALSLSKFKKAYNKEQLGQIWNTLSLLVKDEIPLAIPGITAKEARNPLNPYKINTGSRKDCIGAALITLSEIEQKQRNSYGERLLSLIKSTLANDDPEIRQWAYVAAGECPVTDGDIISAIIAGVGEESSAAARQAISAVSRKIGEFSVSHWNLLVQVLRIALGNADPDLRIIAARAIVKMLPVAPESVKKSFDALQMRLASDICHSVRYAAISEPQSGTRN